jgi:hypothetical protein
MVATMARPLGRTEYCQQQARECAAAAIAALRCEIKEAYLHLEQAWLHLAPEIDDNQYSSRIIRTRRSSTEDENRRAEPPNDVAA